MKHGEGDKKSRDQGVVSSWNCFAGHVYPSELSSPVAEGDGALAFDGTGMDNVGSQASAVLLQRSTANTSTIEEVRFREFCLSLMRITCERNTK